MSHFMEDSVLPLGVRDEDDDTNLPHSSPNRQSEQDDEMFSLYPTTARRSLRFIASLNGCSNGPRDFVYYDSNVHATLPALATNSLRLCIDQDNIAPGTDTLTYPGNYQQLASVSGLHGEIIGDRSPLLAAAFESSSSGRRLHLETLSSETVMPFLRFLYTGSCALSGDWDDVPTSVLLHCKMYWLGDLYDLPDLKSQAYVNVLRQFEFGCSSPQKPIDLCKAIDFAYTTLSGHKTISDAIVQYCVTCCLSHKLHEDADFRDLAFNVRAFHQDLTRVCRDRGYEDESSAIIIQLPYKNFAPATYASRENPPVDVVYHFHSSDRFDNDSSPKKKQRITLDEKRASPVEIPHVPGRLRQPVNVAQGTSSARETPPINNTALPIRRRNIGSQMTGLGPFAKEQSSGGNMELPIRQLDDDLEKLSTAPPRVGFFEEWGFKGEHTAKPARQSDPERAPLSSSQEGTTNLIQESDELTATSLFDFFQQQHGPEAGAGVTSSSKQTSSNPNTSGIVEPREHQQVMQDPDYERRRYRYNRLPTRKPRTSDSDIASGAFTSSVFDQSIYAPVKDCGGNGVSPEAPQAPAGTYLKREPLSVEQAVEKAKDIAKRRKVEEKDRNNLDSGNPWQHSAYTFSQSPHRSRPAPSPTYSSSGKSYGQLMETVNYQAKLIEATNFAPSNVSPTLPPTVFGRFGPEHALPSASLDKTRSEQGIPLRYLATHNLPSGSSDQLNEQNLTNSQREIKAAFMRGSKTPKPVVANAGPATATAPASTNPGSPHALQDYQMQLMLLEQQNKKRRLMARLEQEAVEATHDTASPPLDTKSEIDTISVETQYSVPSTVAAKAGSDILEYFDFDAFLGAEEDMSAVQPNLAYQDYLLQLKMLESQNKKRLLMARQEQDALAMKNIVSGTDGHSDVLGNSNPGRNGDSPKAAQETCMNQLNPTASDFQRYHNFLTSLKRNLADQVPSQIAKHEKQFNAAMAAGEPATKGPSTPTSSPNGIAIRTRNVSEVGADMCETDSDSDMSWVEVPVVPTKPAKPANSTNNPAASGSASSPSSKTATASRKRSSSSSDSEWDFC